MTVPQLLSTLGFLFYSHLAFASGSIPIHDTITLKMEHIEGRWIEEIQRGTKQPSIYIFRSDSTFHKAIDDTDLLLFNVAGTFQLLNDEIKIHYQDFSRPANRKPKMRTMTLHVIALAHDELNIYKTENNQTEFIRLRRQNMK